MKNSARTRAARAYQAANPGTAYTRALRAVATTARRRPLIATIGQAGGSPYRINLEWSRDGGQGPHGLIAGVPGSHAAGLLGVLADALHSQQVAGDLEIIYSSDHALTRPLTADHMAITPADLVDHVDELLVRRLVALQDLGARDVVDARAGGNRMSTVLVLVDRPDDALVAHLEKWLRIGRALGVNFITCVETDNPRGSLVGESANALTPNTTFNVWVDEPGHGMVCISGGIANLVVSDGVPTVTRYPDAIVPFTFDR